MNKIWVWDLNIIQIAASQEDPYLRCQSWEEHTEAIAGVTQQITQSRWLYRTLKWSQTLLFTSRDKHLPAQGRGFIDISSFCCFLVLTSTPSNSQCNLLFLHGVVVIKEMDTVGKVFSGKNPNSWMFLCWAEVWELAASWNNWIATGKDYTNLQAEQPSCSSSWRPGLPSQ